MKDYKREEPFDWQVDIWQPKGTTEMVWIHKDRLIELINMLSVELGNECDDEIEAIFPKLLHNTKRQE